MPYTDIEVAFAKGREQGKAVYAHYTAPWCKPCRKIKAEVYPRPRVAARLARFVRAEIDIQSTDAGRKAWKNYVLKRDASGKTGGWAQPPLPSMLIYEDGVEVEGVRMTGSLTEESIIVGLDRAIAHLGLPPVADPAAPKPAAPAGAAAPEQGTAASSSGCASGQARSPAGGAVVLLVAAACWLLWRRRALAWAERTPGR